MLSAAICKTNGLSAFVIFSCLLQQWCSFSCSFRTSVCAARCRVSSFFRCWSFDVDCLPGMPWGVRVAGRTSRVSRRQQRASLSGRLREINFEFCPLCVLSLRYGLCHRAWLPPLVRRPWGRSLFSRILCTFLALFPPPGRYLRLRGGWNPLRRRYCRANHSGEWRGRRVRASLPHLFCPFANIERSSPEASVCSDVSNVACVNWRPPRGKGCTF